MNWRIWENETAGFTRALKPLFCRMFYSLLPAHSRSEFYTKQRKHPMLDVLLKYFSLVSFDGIPLTIWKSSSEELKSQGEKFISQSCPGED